MPVWEIIGDSLDNTMPDLLNSSFNNILGDSTTQVMGGGRVTNIVGADQKFLFDWEILLDMGLSKLTGEDGPLALMKTYAMGNGGNSAINIGDNNSVNFLGEQLLTAKIGHNFTCSLDETWPTDPANVPTFQVKYANVALASTVNVLNIIICFFIVYFKYHNFKVSGDSESLEPDIETTKAIILGISLGVENRLFLYINTYLQEHGKSVSSESILADQQAKDAAQQQLGADIARAQAAADAAAAAAAAAQATGDAAAAAAAGAQNTATGAATAAADAAAANAANTVLINEQIALLETRLTNIINPGLAELERSSALQGEMLAAANSTIAKLEEDINLVSTTVESANNTIQGINTALKKSWF